MRRGTIGLSLSIVFLSCNNKASDNLKNHDSIGQFSLDSLKTSGLLVEPFKYKVCKIVNKSFRGSYTQIKVCANLEKDGYGSIDSLMISVNNSRQKLLIGKDDFFIDNPKALFNIESSIKLVDFNFDNEPDISIYNTQSGMKNIIENIFIFDKQRKIHLEQDFVHEYKLHCGFSKPDNFNIWTGRHGEYDL